MLEFERQLWGRGCGRVAGVDEAGRGPLAGPVVAAAVVLPACFAEREEQGLLLGLTDSKKLTPARRECFYGLLTSSAGVEIGLGRAEAAEIDALNIVGATRRAMVRALRGLSPLPDHALVDGRPVRGLPCASLAVVGGDGRCLSVAAASVIAKVSRDREMRELDGLYPQYGFAEHKGYGTSRHMQALFEHGPCPAHRATFRPVREAADIRERTANRPAVRQDALPLFGDEPGRA